MSSPSFDVRTEIELDLGVAKYGFDGQVKAISSFIAQEPFGERFFDPSALKVASHYDVCSQFLYLPVLLKIFHSQSISLFILQSDFSFSGRRVLSSNRERKIGTLLPLHFTDIFFNFRITFEDIKEVICIIEK